MNLKDAVNVHEQKAKKKRKRKEIWRKVVIVLIGYPFVFPMEKLKEYVKEKRKQFWFQRLDQLRDKCISEMVAYIEKDMAGEDVYHVYNAPCFDDISYGNAFYLHHFVGYGGFRYRAKEHRNSELFKELYRKQHQATYKESSFYEDLYQTLKTTIQSKYQDIQLTEGADGWNKKYPYFQLKIER
jgi:hypothetical protein